jgi:AcrR family transcriptional regulator
MKNTKTMDAAQLNSRERLLETAIGMFAAKGYAGTSVREIVERAAVSKPVLYYYFKSKEGLFAFGGFKNGRQRIGPAPDALSSCIRGDR